MIKPNECSRIEELQNLIAERYEFCLNNPGVQNTADYDRECDADILELALLLPDSERTEYMHFLINDARNVGGQVTASPARGMQRRNKKPGAQWQDMPRTDALASLSGYYLDMSLIESTLADGNIVQTSFAEYREKPSGKINKCLNCPEVNNKFRLPCDPVECGGKGVCTQ